MQNVTEKDKRTKLDSKLLSLTANLIAMTECEIIKNAKLKSLRNIFGWRGIADKIISEDESIHCCLKKRNNFASKNFLLSLAHRLRSFVNFTKEEKKLNFFCFSEATCNCNEMFVC